MKAGTAYTTAVTDITMNTAAIYTTATVNKSRQMSSTELLLPINIWIYTTDIEDCTPALS